MVRPKKTTEDTKGTAEVGERLKELREMARLSQAEFIKRLGMKNRRTLGAYEKGKVQISAEVARRVCDEFGISFEWLMTGKGPTTRSGALSELSDQILREQAEKIREMVRNLVAEHATGDDPFSKSLKISLDRFEEDFRPELGAAQVTRFVTAVVGTASHLLPDLKNIAVGDTRWSDHIKQENKNRGATAKASRRDRTREESE